MGEKNTLVGSTPGSLLVYQMYICACICIKWLEPACWSLVHPPKCVYMYICKVARALYAPSTQCMNVYISVSVYVWSCWELCLFHPSNVYVCTHTYM